eukprot:1156463-Pelagomonas_calceolata.AAC.5
MHDASEVLGEILNCLHRAEARARAAASPSNSECALYCACSHAKGDWRLLSALCCWLNTEGGIKRKGPGLCEVWDSRRDCGMKVMLSLKAWRHSKGGTPSCLMPSANGGSPSKWVAAAAAGTAAGSAPAAAAVAAGHPALMSTVHQLVGLDVQVRWGTACRLWEGREGFHSSVSADNGSLA